MVEDVADHFSFDRSTIARHVRRTFGLRLEDVIDRARLLYVAALLDETASPVSVVARLLRFPSPETLNKFVKNHGGLTPGQLRSEGALTFALGAYTREHGVDGAPRQREQGKAKSAGE